MATTGINCNKEYGKNLLSIAKEIMSMCTCSTTNQSNLTKKQAEASLMLYITKLHKLCFPGTRTVSLLINATVNEDTREYPSVNNPLQCSVGF